MLGSPVGLTVGSPVGVPVGFKLGTALGPIVGVVLGNWLGFDVGSLLGKSGFEHDSSILLSLVCLAVSINVSPTPSVNNLK